MLKIVLHLTLLAGLFGCTTKEPKTIVERRFAVDTTKRDTKPYDDEVIQNLREALVFPQLSRDFVILGTSLKEIPDSVFLLTNVTRLNIVHNDSLSRISPDICRLSELEVLKLSGNAISCLKIGCLTKLKRLDLRNNRFTSLPDGLDVLSKLTYLSFSNNPLSNGLQNKLPPNVTELYIYNCNLTKFPPEILELANVEKIDISSNHIEKIPRELSKLKNLKQIVISETLVSQEDRKILESSMPWCEFVFH